MLPNAYSLKTKFEFNISKKYGTYYYGKYFHMYVLKPINYKGTSKIGIVISNKFDSKAVVRNRVKRIFKMCFRDFILSKNDLWVVIYPKVICKSKSYEEICVDVNKVLSKVLIK